MDPPKLWEFPPNPPFFCCSWGSLHMKRVPKRGGTAPNPPRGPQIHPRDPPGSEWGSGGFGEAQENPEILLWEPRDVLELHRGEGSQKGENGPKSILGTPNSLWGPQIHLGDSKSLLETTLDQSRAQENPKILNRCCSRNWVMSGSHTEVRGGSQRELNRPQIHSRDPKSLGGPPKPSGGSEQALPAALQLLPLLLLPASEPFGFGAQELNHVHGDPNCVQPVHLGIPKTHE